MGVNGKNLSSLAKPSLTWQKDNNNEANVLLQSPSWNDAAAATAAVVADAVAHLIYTKKHSPLES